MNILDGIMKLANSQEAIKNTLTDALQQGVNYVMKDVPDDDEWQPIQEQVSADVQAKRNQIIQKINELTVELEQYKSTAMPDGGNYCDEGFPDFWSVARPILHLDTCFNCKNLGRCNNYLNRDSNEGCKNYVQYQSERIPKEEDCNNYCSDCVYNMQSCRDGDLRPLYKFHTNQSQLTCEMKKKQ